MKKNNLLFYCFLFSLISFSQDLEIEKNELRKKFFSTIDYQKVFSPDDFKHFEIVSFNSMNKRIPLCINENLEILMPCESKKISAKIIDSIIYDTLMNKIGHCFLGKITKENVDGFWETLKHWKGNITIYDKTESYRLATFMYFEEEKDYFSIMNLDTAANVKMLNKAYKKLLKAYNISKYPDDEDIIKKNKEIEEAFLAISKKIDPDYIEEKNWLETFFSKKRRSDWSREEGYVPYLNRERKELNPVTQEKKEIYPYLD